MSSTSTALDAPESTGERHDASSTAGQARVGTPAIVDAVGSTPLVRLGRVSADLDVEVHAKLEGSNPAGSTKDRVAVHLVREQLALGTLVAGDVVVESSSGNMGIALAQVCLAHDLRFVAVLDPGVNASALRLLHALRAEVELVDDPDEHGSHLAARLDRVRELLTSLPRAYWPDQYANVAVTAAHRRTMGEVVAQLGRPPDAVLVATGTCGTIVGIGEHLASIAAPTEVIAVDAVGSRIFGDGRARRHLPGHGSSRRSDLLRPGIVDRVVHVEEVDAVRGARRLLREEGLLVGASAGAVRAALDEVAADLRPGGTAVLVLADRGERYLETVFDDDWVRRTYDLEPSEHPSWT